MFGRLVFFFLVLLGGCLQRATQYSLRDLNPLGLMELALNDGRITLDELLGEDTSSSHHANHEEPTFFNFFHSEPDFNFNAKEMIEYRGFKVGAIATVCPGFQFVFHYFLTDLLNDLLSFDLLRPKFTT